MPASNVWPALHTAVTEGLTGAIRNQDLRNDVADCVVIAVTGLFVAADMRGFKYDDASTEKCVRCGWRMGNEPLNCQNNDTPHVFPSTLALMGADRVTEIAGIFMPDLPAPAPNDAAALWEIVTRQNRLIGECSQCGQSYAETACGPTHAVISHAHTHIADVIVEGWDLRRRLELAEQRTEGTPS